VHLKFKMVPETLYLTVDLIDRFLEKKQIRRSKLQLVGVSALLVNRNYTGKIPNEIVHFS
jgi:G2/mitotic-specific cyclin-B, other